MSEAPAESQPELAREDHAERTEVTAGHRWLTTMPGLADHGLRVAYACAELSRLRLGDVAAGLNHVCQLAEESDAKSQQVIGAFVPTLVDVQKLEQVWSLRATASAMALMSVSRLLRASTREGHDLDRDLGNPAAGVLQNAAGKPLSLGERRALARQPSRRTIDKLMRDPHPMVTSILLGNPRITENDVVRMAAHRPANTKVAGEVAKRWSRSARVRMALVLNPGVPTAVTVPMLPLLVRPELLQVSAAADLPLVTRATANEHYELRPPMPRRDVPPQKH